MVIWKTYIKGKFFRKKSNNQRVPHEFSPNARKSGKNADKNNSEYGLFIHNATWT